jgi:3D (Asp-Asp-Asp) domain-containing protein
LKVKPILSGSAFICIALLSGSLILSARSSSAETLASQSQQQTQKQTQSVAETSLVVSDTTREGSLGEVLSAKAAEETFVVPPTRYMATAYSLRGRTASGRMVSKGLIAADPRVLPLGSRVRLEAGNYSGEYLVADTGGGVKGKHVDIWIPSSREAMKFGRRTVKLTVLSWGGKKKAAHTVKK